MELEFLPNKIYSVIKNINTDKLNEIRLRIDLPIICKYNFNKYFLSNKGLSLEKKDAIIADKDVFDEIIKNVTEHSLYAHNDRLKNGYLVSKDGERIGVAGECVVDNEVLTIKNITSMLIRVPHKIIGCAEKIKQHIFSNNTINSILIISPPGFGKTTLIKDIIRILSVNNKDILVIDERGELFDKELNADYIRFSNKTFAFEKGIRSLSPEVIITDELMVKDDYQMCEKAVNSGIKVIASVHAKTLKEVFDKNSFAKCFEKYIILNCLKNAGEIKCIYDRHNINFYE